MSGWVDLEGMAAGIDAVTNIVDTTLNYASAYRARRESQEMAKHAHQYEVADLRAAGLNPILSATGGKGSQMPAATHGSSNTNLGLFEKLMAHKMQQQQFKQMDLQNQKINEEVNTEREQQLYLASSALKLDADAKLSDAMRIKTMTDAKVSTAMESKLFQETLSNQYDNWKKQQQNALYKDKKYGKYFGALDYILDRVGK